MRKIQKLIMAVLLVALVMLFIPTPPAFTAGNEEVMFKTQVDVGYWDIWLHADGVTWQYTGKPGDEKSYVFEISLPAEAVNYENVRYEIKAGITKEQFIAAGGRADYTGDENGWDEFDREILTYIPDDYRKTGDTEVTFMLSPLDEARWIKEEWQAELVEGWRWYLPISINWYGVSTVKNDFYTRLELDTDKTEPGKKYTGTVTYGLKDTSDSEQQATANTTLIHRVSERDWPITSIPGEITLQPGEEVSFQFTFTGQDKARSILISEIWPAAGEDPYPADNKAIAQALPVMPVTEPGKSYNPPGSSINLECLDVAYTRNRIPYAPRESKDEASWETTYSWLADIERGCTPWSYSWTDEDGNSHTESGCDPWEKEIWRSETVTYSELLEMKVEIDSWQATEGKGRGVWEIVPLFGAEAHRTVRAGTGFEVNVTTRYATNWETKVPVTADYYGNPVAFGGTYTGPERVFVCFPYANYVKSVAPNNNKDYIVGNKGMGYGELVELEKVEVVKQTDQETIIKWQIKEHSYTGESGRTYSARTHIIDKFWPDAYPDSYDWDITFYKHSNKARVEPKIKFDDRYRFYVVAEMAGKNGLYVIHEDYVYIFGSFFDDIYPTKDPFKDFDDFEW